MFKTLRFKILCIISLLLSLLSIVTFAVAFSAYENGKQVKIEAYDLRVDIFTYDIEKVIYDLKVIVSELASGGTIFAEYKGDVNRLNFYVQSIFENNKTILDNDEINSGGIWFKPYAVHFSQEKLGVFYKNDSLYKNSYMNKMNYNYLNESWYKSLLPKLAEKDSIGWVVPYVDSNLTDRLMTTIGKGIYDKQGKLIGLATIDWDMDSIIDKLQACKTPKHAIILFADKKDNFILYYKDSDVENIELVGKPLTDIEWYKKDLKEKTVINYNNRKYVTFIKNFENGMVFIVNVPTSELFKILRLKILMIILCLFTLYVGVYTALYIFLQQNINNPIDCLVDMAKKMGRGNLDVKSDLTKPAEFAILSKTLNKAVEDIKKYIHALDGYEKERKQAEFELKVAKAIQTTTMPNRFPAFPYHKEFDIYATMDAAKKVGGDFYDFYLINEDKLAFLIADVSGKGIPAALFMMKAKTIIKNIAKTDVPLPELFDKVNKELCQDNDQGLFVTVVLCVMELSTGKVKFVNAGHTHPFIKRADGNFELLGTKQNFVVGGLPDIEYEEEEIHLQANEKIFLYTDGITESTDKDGKMFGETNLRNSLNANKDKSIFDILNNLSADIHEYTKDAEHEQPDDITMLAIEYFGVKNFKLPASVTSLSELLHRVEHICDSLNLDESKRARMMISAEEVFANISSYAYPDDEVGNVEISITNTDDEIEIAFVDSGKRFNPLKHPEPDITLSVEERPIGGLGIHMVKNSMDNVSYEYAHGRNIFKISMNLDKGK